jgi:hypothetical protein
LGEADLTLPPFEDFPIPPEEIPAFWPDEDEPFFYEFEFLFE